MAISPFPLPPEKAITLIRQAANTKNTIVPSRLAEGEWPNVVFHRQVVRCLEDGEIIQGPFTNEYGHFEYKMMRVSAGQEIYLTAVLFKEEDTWKVAVKEVKNGEY
jgi:hypothetical protein